MGISYIQVSEADKGGMALFQRSSDYKYVMVKTSWFKLENDRLVPRSRTKEIRLHMLNWTELDEAI